jgi:flagellar biosynthesis protein FlhG
MYDIVIIDTGAGITDSVMEFVMVSPEVLLVVTPEPTSITDAYSLLKVLRRKDEFNPLYKTINVVANRTTSDVEGREIFEKINTVSSKFLNTDLKYLGSIPQDKSASMAIIQQKAVVMSYPISPMSKAVSDLADKLFDDVRDIEEKRDGGIARVFLNFIRSKRSAR